MTLKHGSLRWVSLAVCLCVLTQHLAIPLHVLVEDHCRVTDGVGPRPAGLTPDSFDHRACAGHDRLHHHLHACLHDHDAHPHHQPDPVGSAHEARGDAEAECGDCAGSHCPHPVEEHLVEMKGQPARSPSVAAVMLALLGATPSAVPAETPPRIDSAHRTEASPGKPPPPSPTRPRAPPFPRAVLPA